MTTTKEKIAVMQHFNDGGEVEDTWLAQGAWRIQNSPNWDWSVRDYRIKAKPEYAPYTAETFPKGMVWVRGNGWTEDRSIATTVNSAVIWVDGGDVIDYNELLIGYKISLDGGITWQIAGELK